MAQGGFDAILTNPPWEIFKPDAKEFFHEYSALVTKKKMTIKEFEAAQATLLADPEVRAAWLAYQSRFPHVSAFYRGAPQYRNQIAVVNGKKAGSDTNFYKLFVEQCYNLLRDGGRCGLVIPSGIYTDLGTKQLRELLFSECSVQTLFGLSNEKYIFEGVHHAFKVCLLVFAKGDQTVSFPAAFRINPREAVAPNKLEGFLATVDQHIQLPVTLIRRLSPDSLSIMEFKNDTDKQIAEKLLAFPLLGEKMNGVWNLRLTREFDMTNDSGLFKTSPASGRLPLYEGKMIHQFTNALARPKYWVDETEGRKAVLGRDADHGQQLDYQTYRVGFRDIASNTNERTLISTLIPPAFHGNKLPTARVFDDQGAQILDSQTQLLLAAIWNSFIMDWMIRLKITTTINYFYLYQLPVPRLTASDAAFRPIVERAAKLICTTAEFDDLAAAAGIGDHTAGVTDPAARAALRADLDALVAHVYGLTEAEFAHILQTFPLVEPAVKDAALQAFRARLPDPSDAQVAALIAGGEDAAVEFKVAALVNPYTGKVDNSMADNVVQGVASYLNSYDGGSLLIGVHDKGTLNDKGKLNDLSADYAAANAQKNSRDGYALWLNSKLSNLLGADKAANWTITFHRIKDSEVCRIAVRPAAAPVFLSGDLYVRVGVNKKKLSTQEAHAYIPQRWPVK